MEAAAKAGSTEQKSQYNDERHLRSTSGLVPVTWLLLAVLLASCLFVAACALWLPDRAPAPTRVRGRASLRSE
ncbi:hypothetical protein BBOH_0009 [Bifidobacterium bohemicum DSM 22767]|uniref:Uncharacterized protein n=1 Tax=Bifidobacterium bohemicum DSM 22767 TaxID=1437606 RepID=A0A086ZJ40_9BIFI|nr:hypothetical protein BBOH_0009 [Bifidobacterium bohemicum DSM 22767]